ncbi:sigma-70 family RNA polymerase sigma factor [Pseudonocardia sp.]|uniref:sigma-70 family RNA polymerase sigma factor n=1 Tax=Pseudonocardia sp. TaxID=60912 RepID=UPI002633D807|nr:sigma-70 family RNA polymerase sigma factor [Pseudonocardia sp.]
MDRTGRADRASSAERHSSDEALVHAVYSEHGRAMLVYATRLLDDRAAAEDVVQEALIRAWRNPDVLTNGRGSVRGWLLTVVRNIVIDRVRARDARPREVSADRMAPGGAGAGDRPPVTGDHADSVAAAVTVHAALGTLSTEHRAVLEQVYLHGRNLDEAAAVLGVPKGTVKSRSYYALRALRAAMERA